MAYNATVLDVFIASPADVAQERALIRTAIHEWNAIHAADRRLVLMPVGWESHASPQMGERPQEVINGQLLAASDLLIAVFWTRLGSPTGEAPSGTAEEIEKHLAAEKPAMIYFSNAPVRPDSINESQYQALRTFRADLRRRGLTEEYDSPGEFREKLGRQLTQTIIRSFPSGSSGAGGTATALSVPAAPAMSGLATAMLRELANDENGVLLRLRSFDGLTLTTNGKQLVIEGDVRDEARGEAALKELLRLRLVDPRGRKGEVFGITDEGYQAAERLGAGPSVIS